MNHIDELIQNGSMAYFAVDDEDKVIVTCMLEPLGNNVWKICKSAATGQYTGTGAGNAVLKEHTVKHGAKNLV